MAADPALLHLQGATETPTPTTPTCIGWDGMAHNPGKINSSLRLLCPLAGRIAHKYAKWGQAGRRLAADCGSGLASLGPQRGFNTPPACSEACCSLASCAHHVQGSLERGEWRLGTC